MRKLLIFAFTILSKVAYAQCDTTGVLLELQATTYLQGILFGDARCLTTATVVSPLYVSNDSLFIDTTGLGGGGSAPIANNGVSDNEDGGKIRLGNRYMGTPDAPFTMARKINIDGRLLHIGDLSDSTLFVVDGAMDRVGIRTDAPAKDLDVNGETRIRDLSNGTPDRVVGANSDGDLSRLFLSGMSVVSGVLTATDSSATNEAWTIDADDADTELISNQTLKFQGAGIATTDYDPATNVLLITATEVGTGTVTSFSAGNLTPLFTTVENNPTTTPDLQFTLTNAAANTYFGNATGAGAAPSYTAAGALTKTDDTNVTLTLGGNPNTSLLRAVSLTMGWTGTLAETRGGTGKSVYVVGDLLQANTTTTLATLAAVATGNVLLSGGVGVVSSWGKVGLTTHVSGDLPFANLAQGSARSVLGVSGNALADNASIQSGGADQVLRTNAGNTAIGWGQVATGGILDDAITYAKIQNVVDDERILGRVSGANGNVEELTVAQVYTMMGITAQDTRVAIGKGANVIGHDAGLVFDYTNDRQTISCTTPALGAGAAILNVTNVGTDDPSSEFIQARGNILGNLICSQSNVNSDATSNCFLQIQQQGDAAGDPFVQFSITGSGGITHSIGIDNSNGNRLKLTPNATTPGGNVNMGVIIRDNGGVGNTGINKDFPGFPLDGLGTAQFELWQGTGNLYGAGNVTFGNGAGTGPSVNSITGTGNSVRLDFSTGTGPTADGDVLTITYPFAFTTTSIVTFSARDSDAADANFYISAENGTSCTLKIKGTLTASRSYSVNFHYWGY